MGMIFLISSSGFMMYKTSCSCTGIEQTSVFVRPETCEEIFHEHHLHDFNQNEVECSSIECHDCSDHTKSCGCDSPEIFFFKLKDKAIGDEIDFVTVQGIELFVARLEILAELAADNLQTCEQSFYPGSPPNVISSFDFLIQIHQLKIPLIA
ncbi:hypothetical protein [Draconibacterium aestuarii]|uniref:hypothetical protein n=1 Tax=Draconibacterium aestuarii TaxID=2998507 RepID=UPI0031BA087E